MDKLKKLPNDYKEDIKKAIKILKGNGTTEIFIFGSAASGKVNKNSDIDIAVRGLEQKDFYKVASILMFELEKEIDLVDLDDKTDRFSQMLLKSDMLVRIDNLL